MDNSHKKYIQIILIVITTTLVISISSKYLYVVNKDDTISALKSQLITTNVEISGNTIEAN